MRRPPSTHRARWARSLCAGFALVAATPALAETVTINGVTYEKPKAGNPAPVRGDDSLRVKKVFLFPSLDDLSGVMTPRLDERLVQLFTRNTRFDLVRDLQVIKALSPDDSAYTKAAMSSAVHREAARVSGADTTAILRSRNVGNQSEMVLELRDSQGDLLFSEAGTVPGFSSMQARWGMIDRLFQAVLAKIPFDGTVTGRSVNTLTLDLGAGLVRVGDEVELARIVSVQRHPLLRTVVGTDYARGGRARVTSVDRALSFAELIEEFPGASVGPGAKVILPRLATFRREDPSAPRGERPQPGEVLRKPDPDPMEDRLTGDFDDARPRYGQVGASPVYGSLGLSQSASGQTQEISGGGLGVSVEGELWVTKNWIVAGSYGFQNASLAGNGISAGDSGWRKIEGAAGFRFFPADLAEGASVTGYLGYQMEDFSLPTVSGAAISGKQYTGIMLKVAGEIFLARQHKISGDFAFQPFSSLTDEGAAPGEADGGNVVAFQIAWNYRVGPNFWARLGVLFDTASGNYLNNSSVTTKRFAIGPGIYYSF